MFPRLDGHYEVKTDVTRWKLNITKVKPHFLRITGIAS